MCGTVIISEVSNQVLFKDLSVFLFIIKHISILQKASHSDDETAV